MNQILYTQILKDSWQRRSSVSPKSIIQATDVAITHLDLKIAFRYTKVLSSELHAGKPKSVLPLHKMEEHK